MNVDLSLYSRLRSCLQAILDLKSELNSASFGGVFMIELERLGKYLDRLDSISLHEEDVRRIEKATVFLLEELSGLFASREKGSGGDQGNARLQ